MPLSPTRPAVPNRLAALYASGSLHKGERVFVADFDQPSLPSKYVDARLALTVSGMRELRDALSRALGEA